MLFPATLTVAILALLGGPAHPRPVAPVRPPYTAQVSPADPSAAAVQAVLDSAAALDRARELQARFERVRVRELPRTLSGGSPECDEVIGRLCIWDDSDEGWEPREEAEAIGNARTELLASLDSVAGVIPGDHWVFGQRIRYLTEAGRLGHAESLARACGLPEPWRCDAYLGFVHHHQEEIGAAETAFRRALAAMPPAIRSDWTDPGPVLDHELRDWLPGQADSAGAVARLWTLADPLFLAEGNDRWTAHLSRWVYAMSSEGARSPHQLRWGDDLTEAVVRYGWPISWERSWPRGGQTSFSVTGRDPPAATRTFPPRRVLGPGRPGEGPVPWETVDGHARSEHLPPYLDSLAALEGQVGRFWRRDGVVVAGAWRAPGPVRAGAAADDEAAGSRIRAGLFVEQGGAVEVDVRTAADPGSPVRLSGRVPWAEWGVVSLETWAPGRRRAYRRRAAMGFGELLPDLFAISDLMLLEPDAEPDTFPEMLGLLRASTTVQSDEPLGVAFEIYGLGFRSEALGFSAWVEKRGEGFFTRAVRWLGLGGPGEEVSIRWEEAGPNEPRPFFRTFRIGLPGLDPGEYDVVVEVSAEGRSPLSGRRSFNVR